MVLVKFIGGVICYPFDFLRSNGRKCEKRVTDAGCTKVRSISIGQLHLFKFVGSFTAESFDCSGGALISVEGFTKLME